MKIKGKIALATIMSLLLMPLSVVNAQDNVPNTSLSDVDKKSECEVTADVHYAYYVSMPACLTLEPFDINNIQLKALKLWFNNILRITNFDSNSIFLTNYKIKAKITTNGLSDKYIMIKPKGYVQTGESTNHITHETTEIWGYICDWITTFEGYSFISPLWFSEIQLYNVDNSPVGDTILLQDTVYFGENGTNKVVTVVSDKWTTIDGAIFADLEQGIYKGNFEFEYGLVDTLDLP